jgi:hypothetical protein
VDCNKRIVMFGYSLMSTETAKDFKRLIANFIEIMGKPPSTFVTDEQASIVAALKELKSERVI